MNLIASILNITDLFLKNLNQIILVKLDNKETMESKKMMSAANHTTMADPISIGTQHK